MENDKSKWERKTGGCELCGNDKELTFHHLIPKLMHSKPRFQKRYTKKEMQTRGLYICRCCHSGLHDLFSEKELGESYNTKELLLAHEGVKKHVAWAAKQK